MGDIATSFAENSANKLIEREMINVLRKERTNNYIELTNLPGIRLLSNSGQKKFYAVSHLFFSINLLFHFS